MPKVREGEGRSEYVARCVPEAMKEGLTQEQAVGKCEGTFSARKSAESPQDCAIRKALEAPLPEGATVSGRTAQDGTGHAHGYALRGGDGTTSDAGGHRHQVRGWLVMPAGGHTHVLDRVYSGARKEASEHGTEPSEALRTAVEHVSEHPNYYRVLESVEMCGDPTRNPMLTVEKAGKPVGSTSQRADGTWRKVGEGDWRKVPESGLSRMGQPKKYATPAKPQSNKPSVKSFEPKSLAKDKDFWDWMDKKAMDDPDYDTSGLGRLSREDREQVAEDNAADYKRDFETDHPDHLRRSNAAALTASLKANGRKLTADALNEAALDANRADIDPSGGIAEAAKALSEAGVDLTKYLQAPERRNPSMDEEFGA